MFQHTAARRRLDRPHSQALPNRLFQHTAARRRLVCIDCQREQEKYGFNTQPPEGGWFHISQITFRRVSFNTQPPEGGWNHLAIVSRGRAGFQHTAARRRLGPKRILSNAAEICFNTQPPEGGWNVHIPELHSFFLFQHTAA